jgi:serine/threonine protein kinase
MTGGPKHFLFRTDHEDARSSSELVKRKNLKKHASTTISFMASWWSPLISSKKNPSSPAVATSLGDKAGRRKHAKLANDQNQVIESATKITLLHQHQELITNFKLLKDKYDDIKKELHKILWEFMPTQDIEDALGFSDLGPVNHATFETSDRIGCYAIGRSLGEGQFSDVKVSTHNVTGKQYAVKIIPKSKISTLSGLKRVRTEVNLLHNIRHPNIIKFVDYIHSPTCLYIFTELGGQDLFEFSETNPSGTNPEVTRQVILGIANALLYLHDSGICHRDLKPENILLNRAEYGDRNIYHYNIRVCDFGHSAVVVPKNNRIELTDLCGSPGFFAPEMILGGDTPYNGFAADVWSVGCIMLELMLGHDNFCHLWMTSYDYDVLMDECKFENALNDSVMNVRQRQQYLSYHEGLKEDMTLFLLELLVVDPNSRLSTSEMLSHSWLKGYDSRQKVEDTHLERIS